MNSQGSRYRRIPTYKECKYEEFCLQTSLGGDIFSFKGPYNSFSWIAVLRGKVDAYIQLHVFAEPYLHKIKGIIAHTY